MNLTTQLFVLFLIAAAQISIAMKANQGRSRWEQHFYSKQMEKPSPEDNNLMSDFSESVIGNEWEVKVPFRFQNEICDGSGAETQTNKIMSNVLNDKDSSRIS